MSAFNKAISGPISVDEAYFGEQFKGYVPSDHQLKDKNAIEQFKKLAGILDFSEFSAEVSANRKAIFLNCLFWLKSGLPALGCTCEQRFLFFTKLGKAWEGNTIEVPLPVQPEAE
jgi:hypothetical protein